MAKPKRQSAAFYFSVNPGPDRTPITAKHPVTNKVVVIGFVRADVFTTPDLEEALDRATRQPDESVMNTHEVRL